jgi:hypothetical protein
MSVTLREVLEFSGYKPLNNRQDATWLLSRRNEFTELLEGAESLLEDLAEQQIEDENDLRAELAEEYAERSRLEEY